MPHSRTLIDGPYSIGSFGRFSDAWLECMRFVMSNGVDIRDRDVKLRESLNLSISGTTCEAEDFLNAGANPERLDLMIRKYHSVHPVHPYTMSYGQLFYDHFGVNQITWLADQLRRKRETKSATISFHEPGKHELSCISLFDCKLREGQLHVNVVYRSQNVFASQPGNVLALAKFQQEIAGLVGAHAGLLVLHLLSAHIYHDDFPSVQRILEY